MKKIKENIGYLRRDLLRAAVLLWKADRVTALTNLLLQLAQAFLPIASLYFIKELIDALTKGHEQFIHIVPLLIAFGVIQLLLALATQYSSYIITLHQQKLTDYLSARVLDKAIDVEYAYYENPEYHDTLHLAQRQSLYRATTLLSNFSSLLQSSLSMIFLVLFFISLHSLFALLFMVLSIPLTIINWYSGYALVRLEREFAPLERDANYLHQTLTEVNYAKEVRVFGFGSSFIKKFNAIRHRIYKQKKDLYVKLTRYSLAAEIAEIIVMTFIFGMLAKFTWEKTITIGVFVIYIQGFQRLQNTSKNFMQSLVQIFQQRIFLKDLFAFFDIETNPEMLGHEPFPSPRGELMVDKVSFTYPQTTKAVLHNVSISCRPGEIIAIVGENGSGKSTLVKLLARLYSLQSGSVTINGKKIGDIRIKDFRKETIFLFQDFEKYFLTIEQNIALGEEEDMMSAEAIQHAAKLSGAHDFITKLSNGYKTRMGRLFVESEQISGGQWQKLALARIFYRDTSLVILDEPTSALDATAEFELFKNIKELLNNKMVILITHRLYNLKIADYVYVMQDGHIAEEGTFEHLITKDGTFRKMYDAQKL